MSKWRRRLRDALYFSLGILLIIFMMLRADFTDTLERMAGVNIGILLLILLLYLFNTGAKVLRWWVLLWGMGVKGSGKVVVPIYLAALALNNTLPGKVGGEPVRALMLKEHTGAKLSSSIASIVMDKSMDILFVLILSMAGLLYLILKVGFGGLTGLIVVISVAGISSITIFILMLNKNVSHFILRQMERLNERFTESGKKNLVGKIVSHVQGFMLKYWITLGRLRRNKRAMIAVIALTTSIWLNEALRFYLAVIALPGGHQIPFLGAVAAVSIGTILSLVLPIGSGNVLGGTSITYLLTHHETLSTAASIIAVATSIWLSIPMGLASLYYLRRRAARIEREKREKGG